MSGLYLLLLSLGMLTAIRKALALVAAGFSAGEADQLRRCMAAWHRKGGLEPFEKRLLGGMKARGYPESFARRIFNQIKGFGEYGFPESHSAGLWELADNAWARAAGIVTSRQRPATSSGVMFFTLEDETGFINSVIWPSIFAEQGAMLAAAKLLEISGVVQKQDGVLHLVARQCTDLSPWLGDMQLKSRDFC